MVEPFGGPLKISAVHGIQADTVGPDTVFRSAKAAQLYRWWAGFEDPPPRRADFDVVDHATLIADLFLVQVLDNDEFLLKIHGQNVIDLFGINNTGRVVTRHEGVGDFGHALNEYYRSVVALRRCRRCTGDLEHRARKHVRFESIDCPLVDDAGAVTAIIGVIEQIV